MSDPSAALAAEYSDKASAYLRQWSPVIAPMALPLLDRLPLAASKWVLDLGAGTGAQLEPIAARAPAALVLGVDRAIDMLRIARRRTPHRLAAMDAQSLAMQSATIDVATIGAALDSRTPIVMQQERMDTADKLSALLRTAPFGVVQIWTHVFEHRWTIDAIIDVQLGCGMAARRIGSLSRSDAAEYEARARQRLASLNPELLTYRPEILFATASARFDAA